MENPAYTSGVASCTSSVVTVSIDRLANAPNPAISRSTQCSSRYAELITRHCLTGQLRILFLKRYVKLGFRIFFEPNRITTSDSVRVIANNELRRAIRRYYSISVNLNVLMQRL